MIERQLDGIDRIIELEYMLVARTSKEHPNQSTKVGRSAMRVLVVASTFRLMLELWRENLESLLDPESLRWTTAPPPAGYPFDIEPQ
jgi:hypothetical protein